MLKKTFLPSLISMLILCLSSLFTFSQEKFSIQINDEQTNLPIPYASVIYTEASDTLITSIHLSDNLGHIFLSFKANTFKLHITHIGYEMLDTTIALDPSTLVITLKMTPKSILQDSLLIIARKKSITTLPGGYEFFLDGKRENLNINSAEILKHLPGMTQDSKAGFRLMGQNMVLWVDGRKIMMQGDELASFLKTLNSKDIRSIKVYTTPPSIYDASSGNVVEIITNNYIKNGLEVRLDASIGTHNKAFAGFNIAYSNKAYSGYLRASFNHYTIFSKEGTDQYNYTLPDSLRFYRNQTNLPSFVTNTVSISTNHDYAFTAKSIIGFTLRYNQYDSPSSLTSSDLTIYNSFLKLTREERFIRLNDNTNKFFFTGGNYRYKINDKGATLTIDGSTYIRDNIRGYDQKTSIYNEANRFINFSDIRKNRTNNNATVRIGTLNYFTPFNSKIQLRLGGKFTYVNNKEELNEYNSQDGFLYFKDSQNTFSLSYKENITAAYFNFSGILKKLNYQVGIRWENTKTIITTLKDVSTTKNSSKYSNFFPSIAGTYTINPHLNLSLGLKRSIIRITYDQLNPLNLRRNAFMSYTGNPFLKPILQDAADLSINKIINDNHSIRFMSKFSVSRDPFLPIVLSDTTPGQFIEKYFTYKGNTSIYSNVTHTGKVTTWLDVVTSLYGFDTWIELNHLANLSNPKPVATFGASIDLIASFLKNASAEIFAQYQSHQVFAQGYGGKYFYVDITLSKSFFKEQLNLNLSLNDVLNSNKQHTYILTPFLQSTYFLKDETRILQLSLSYKFGKKRSNKIRPYQNQDDSRFVR